MLASLNKPCSKFIENLIMDKSHSCLYLSLCRANGFTYSLNFLVSNVYAIFQYTKRKMLRALLYSRFRFFYRIFTQVCLRYTRFIIVYGTFTFLIRFSIQHQKVYVDPLKRISLFEAFKTILEIYLH